MVEKSVGYGVSLIRLHGQGNWVEVSLRKHYWHVHTGSRSRMVATAAFDATGMSERDIVEASLRELLRSYVDEIA